MEYCFYLYCIIITGFLVNVYVGWRVKCETHPKKILSKKQFWMYIMRIGLFFLLLCNCCFYIVLPHFHIERGALNCILLLIPFQYNVDDFNHLLGITHAVIIFTSSTNIHSSKNISTLSSYSVFHARCWFHCCVKNLPLHYAFPTWCLWMFSVAT